MLERLDIRRRVGSDARAADVGPIKKLRKVMTKLGGAGDPMSRGVLVHLYPEVQIDLVETHRRAALVLASRADGHGEERALRHGRQRVRADVALGPGAQCEAGIRAVLLPQILNGIPICDCDIGSFLAGEWLELGL